jgi:hypothetical protein
MTGDGAIASWRSAARVVRAVFALLALDRSLRRRGFAFTHEHAREAARPASRRRADGEVPGLPEAERTAALVAIAARIARVRCLPRSLLLYRWLGRAGAPVRLCIGVRRQPSGLRAHAWVEWLGPEGETHALGESPSVRADFAVLSGTADGDPELQTTDFSSP